MIPTMDLQTSTLEKELHLLSKENAEAFENPPPIKENVEYVNREVDEELD
jgi:hypothetical protein